ncbi:patatin-like phospholipase family protein [Candidatus Odyssella acanthamoebae]|uniref:PNPLA domain-containing protein n=1 Tax=Candidatus Odyssella acanthamoebae TaxID=91604 RepID=A0A077AUC9_9PROT|nr:patatin-like phospholipase family protein [Candidatus Paracaedibacter acanthamoebae]AIK96797.1 hypothetical protein ID47_08750 [Candidatus Paracaedibacter acanthamoebae]
MLKFAMHIGRLCYISFILISVTIAEDLYHLSSIAPSSYQSIFSEESTPTVTSFLESIHKIAETIEDLNLQHEEDGPDGVLLERLKIKLSKKIQKYAKKYADGLDTTTPLTKFRILSLDGGGIRGFLECIFLSHLSHLTGKPIHELFDMIIATSTGTLIAAGLTIEKPENYKADLSYNEFMPYRDSVNSPHYTPEELATIYLQDGPNIFSQKNSWLRAWLASWVGDRMGACLGSWLDPWLGSWLGPKYNDTDLNKTLEQFFGDKTLKDLKLPVFLTAYDLDNKKIMTFSTLEPQDSTEKNVFLRDALRACVAAPTIFAPVKILHRNTCDAGIFLNNPAELGLSQATHYLKTSQDQIILFSLGCGYNTDSKDSQTYQNMGLKGWAEEFMNTACDGQRTHDSISHRHKSAKSPTHYCRVSPLLKSKEMQMDSTKVQDFKTWADAAKKEILLRKDDIGRLAEQLIASMPPIEKQQAVPFINSISKENESLLAGDLSIPHTLTAVAADAGSSCPPPKSSHALHAGDLPQ